MTVPAMVFVKMVNLLVHKTAIPDFPLTEPPQPVNPATVWHVWVGLPLVFARPTHRPPILWIPQIVPTTVIAWTML